MVSDSLRIPSRSVQGTLVVGAVQKRRAIDAIRHLTAGGIRRIQLTRPRETFRRRGRRRGGRGLLRSSDSVDPGLTPQRRGWPFHFGRVRGGFGDDRCHGWIAVALRDPPSNAMRLGGNPASRRCDYPYDIAPRDLKMINERRRF